MVITGWKSIATTLNVSVATAKRLRSVGLPVANLSARCVATTVDRLMAWRADRDATLSRRVADALRSDVREGNGA